MTTVATHLFLAYRKTYAWFWTIMALMLAGVGVSFEIFGHYTLDSQRVSVWETVSPQAPRWFLFVMALLFVTVNLPVVIAHGITRRAYFQGAALFALASSAFAATFAVLGFGVERTVYHFNGMLADVGGRYPVNTLGQAGRLWAELLITFSAYMVSGWLAGLVFYRLHVVTAILCTPLAAAPLIAISAAPLGKPPMWELALTLAVTLIGGLAGYALVRTVAVKARKA